jgi:predicted metal-binding membrane protein
MTAAVDAPALHGERRFLLLTLSGLAVVGWAVVIWQSITMDGTDHASMHMDMDMDMDMHMDMAMGGIDLTMGMAAPLFLAMWVAMMVGMMFPAAAPMILAFERSQSRKRAAGAPFTPTWMFVAPYLAVWSLFGLLGYGLALTFEELTEDTVWAADDVSRIAAGFLIAAGLYQLSPLKRVCLSRCRTPLSFMLSYWRDGRRGALTMGLRHGLYCLGCCWVLFLLLFPIGVMNVAAMVAVTALVFAEKALPGGERVALAAAVVLVVYGALAMAVPDLLPTAVT